MKKKLERRSKRWIKQRWILREELNLKKKKYKKKENQENKIKI